MTGTEPADRGRRLSLRTSRMEALSDGIFAIAATLLVLDLAIPKVSSDVSAASSSSGPPTSPTW
jgi:uncharacterized membrane protein